MEEKRKMMLDLWLRMFGPLFPIIPKEGKTMHILKQYHLFDIEKLGINKNDLLEIESMYKHYGHHFHLTEEDLKKCDEIAKVQINEDLKNSDEPLKAFTTIIAMNKINTLIEKIHEKQNIPISKFSYTLTHTHGSLTITLYLDGKEVELDA